MTTASALQCSPAQRSTTLLSFLNSLLLRIEGMPIVLLRPLPTNFDSQVDDIDLLLSTEQRFRVLQMVFDAAAAEQVHFRIQQSSEQKVQLKLWTENCDSNLIVDLWSSFSQLPYHRRTQIQAEHFSKFQNCRPPAEDSEPGGFQNPLPATVRLRSDIEFCLLILHLASKKKPLSSPVVRERLESAFHRLRILSVTDRIEMKLDFEALMQTAENTCAATNLRDDDVRMAESYLFSEIAGAQGKTGQCEFCEERPHRLVDSVRRWIARCVPAIAIVGSDGSGKTTMSKTLADSSPMTIQTLIAKKLYRRSLMYRLVSGVAKRKGQDRGLFDDKHCVILTIRAAIILWAIFLHRLIVRFFRNAACPGNPPLMLLDRSVSSFLIQDRKSSDPQLHPWAKLIERYLPPVTTVLLTVSYALLSSRKQEMTLAGHRRYQQILVDQSLRQTPVDLLVIANNRNASDSASAIQRILDVPVQRTESAMSKEFAA